MRSLAASLVVLTASLGPSLADPTGDLLKAYYGELKSIRAGQQKFCVKPRNNTASRCNADFEAVYLKINAAIGAQVMYWQAHQAADPLAPIYKAEHERTKQEMVSAQREVERLYYPPTR